MIKTISFKIKLAFYSCLGSLQRLRAGDRTLFQNILSILGLIPQKIHDINRHISISLMAVLFVGGSVASSSAESNVNLALLFPPSAETTQSIVDDIRHYTPSINEDTVVTVKSYVGIEEKNYIEQLQILSADVDNNPLAGVGVQYTIQKGDAYSTIAARFNLDVGSILAANGHTPEELKKNVKLLNLKAGDIINIPAEPLSSVSDWKLALEESRKAELQTRELIKNKNKLKVTSVNKNKRNGKALVSVSNKGKDFTARLGFYGGQCTAGVAKLRGDIAAKIRANGGGNGGQWYSVAKRAGMSVGQIPAPGAVIVTAENAWAGHVAYVEAVNGDTVSLVDMNYGAGNTGRYTRRTVNYKSISTKGFIY